MHALWVHAIVPTPDIVGFELPGEEGGAVYTVPAGPLAALVQPTDHRHAGELSEPARRAHEAIHEAALERMGERYPLLPVAPGTILADEMEVQRMLRFGKATFEQLLVAVVGLEQVEVAILQETEGPGSQASAPLVGQLRALLDQQVEVVLRALETTLQTLALRIERPPLEAGVLVRQVLLLGADGRRQLQALLGRIAPYLDARWRAASRLHRTALPRCASRRSLRPRLPRHGGCWGLPPQRRRPS